MEQAFCCVHQEDNYHVNNKLNTESRRAIYIPSISADVHHQSPASPTHYTPHITHSIQRQSPIRINMSEFIKNPAKWWKNTSRAERERRHAERMWQEIVRIETAKTRDEEPPTRGPGGLTIIYEEESEAPARGRARDRE